MLTILRPLSTSELLDRTFHLYKNNFIVFFAIVAIPQLVLLGAKLFYARYVYANDHGLVGFLVFAASILSVVCLGISGAATVYAVSNLHLGRPARIRDAFGAIGKRFMRYMWIAFATSYIIVLGFVLLVIPGVIMMLRYALTMPSAVVEDIGLRKSLSRSSVLGDEDYGRILVHYALFTLLTWSVSSLVHFALGMRLPFTRVHGPVVFHATQYVVLSISTCITQSLVGPLLTIALTLLYYDERVRKEGFDLQLMMSNLESAAPSAAAAVPAS